MVALTFSDGGGGMDGGGKGGEGGRGGGGRDGGGDSARSDRLRVATNNSVDVSSFAENARLLPPVLIGPSALKVWLLLLLLPVRLLLLTSLV